MDQPWPDQLTRALEAITAAIENQNRLIESQSEQLRILQSLSEHGRRLQTCDTPDAHHELSSGEEAAHGNNSDDYDHDPNHDDEALTRRVKRVFHRLIDPSILDHDQGLIPIQSFEPYNRVGGWYLESLSSPNLQFGFHEPPLSGTCTSSWKYWRLVNNDDSCSDNTYSTGRGRPDYIPVWELAPKTESREEWYHIDDPNQGVLFPGPHSKLSSYCRFVVPYAFSPLPSYEPYSNASLHPHQSQIIGSLGQLYAVPPDSRVTLRFERNQLRLATTESQLDEYLDSGQEFFQAIGDAGGFEGFFRVTDFDDFMNSADYDSGVVPQHPRDSHGFPAGPALAVEEFQLNIPPDPYLWVPDPEPGLPVGGKHTELGGRRWHRVIHLNGLAHMNPIACVQRAAKVQTDPSKVWKLLIRHQTNTNDGYGLPLETLEEIFSLHLSCGKLQQSYNPYQGTLKPFHVTWYRSHQFIAKRKPDSNLKSLSWKSGTFFGTRAGFQECAFTFALIPSQGYGNLDRDFDHLRPRAKETLGYCTFLLLTPLGTNIDAVVVDEFSPHTMALRMILAAFRDAADSWEEITHHLTEILSDDDDAVLDPDKHDRLLFDDSAFSRSRRYFWAADILVTFQDTIENMLKQWEYWWDAWGGTLTEFQAHQRNRLEERERNDEEGKPHLPWKRPITTLEEALASVTSQVNRMKQINTNLGQLATTTKTLRDGLFSASGVIESRASTDLGQNVKLLTYVSIFYMPVGICAAVWSINADYGLTAFGIVTAAVALLTYVVVGNLNNAVDAVRRLYRGAENWVVADMIEKSKDESWKEKGFEFNQFRPKRENIMPSRWYILWYVIVRNVRLLPRLAPPPNDAKDPGVPSEVSQQGGAEGENCETKDNSDGRNWSWRIWGVLKRENSDKGKDPELGPIGSAPVRPA